MIWKNQNIIGKNLAKWNKGKESGKGRIQRGFMNIKTL